MLPPFEIVHYGFLGFYLCVTLFLGFQCTFDAFKFYRFPHTPYMRFAGVAFLLDSASILVGGFIHPFFPECHVLVHVGYIFDLWVCIMLYLLGFRLSSGTRLHWGTILAVSFPLLISMSIGIMTDKPSLWCSRLFNLTSFAIFVVLGVRLYRHDRSLPLYYSNTERRRASWFFYYAIWVLVIIPLYTYPKVQANFGGWLLPLIYAAMITMQVYLARKLYRFEINQIDFPHVITEASAPVQKQKVADAISLLTEEKRQQMTLQLRQLMEEDKLYTNPELCVDDLVRRLNTNSAYFYYFMRDVMHTRFFDMVKNYRIQEAKRLLLTDESIENIALSCGYYSASSFTRVFKGQEGMTPSQWRAENKGKSKSGSNT